jgi:molybdopterin converting factor small subunit
MTQQTEKYDAQLREADASLKVLAAKAEARKAKADMDEISGLTAAKEQVRQDIDAFKKFAAADYAQTKKDAEQLQRKIDTRVQDLQARIERASDRYSAWDDARERRFNARLDAADAEVKFWKSKADQQRAQNAIDSHNALATLEEKIATARARAAEAKRERYSAKSQQALEDADRYFAQAYDAAAKRYADR